MGYGFYFQESQKRLLKAWREIRVNSDHVREWVSGIPAMIELFSPIGVHWVDTKKYLVTHDVCRVQRV